MTEAEKQIIDLLRGIRTEVLDLKVRIQGLEAHLRRQDKEAMEILAASRRLMMTIEAIDNGEDDDGPLQN
jgi:hypothetical protein